MCMEKLDRNTASRTLRDKIYSLERDLRYLSGIKYVDIRYYDTGYSSITLRMKVELYEDASRRWAESDIKRKVESFVSDMIHELSRDYDTSSWYNPNIWLDIDFEGGN